MRTAIKKILQIVIVLFLSVPLWAQNPHSLLTPPVADTYVMDLIVFRWICAQALVNADTVLLTRRLNQEATKPISKTSNWALMTFAPTGNPAKLALPDSADNRTEMLLSMKSEVTKALRNRKSYPVDAAAGLNRAQLNLGSMGLEISQAMLFKLLGDLCLYDMSNDADALAYYSRATLIFGKTVEAYAANAQLYDDLAYLKSEQGVYNEAKEHFIQAALHWQALVNENPNDLSLLLNVGIKYIQAGDADRAAGNFDSAIDLKNKGLDSLRKYAHASKSYTVLMQHLIDTAEMHSDRGNPQRANVLLEEAQKLVERTNDYLLTARLYKTIAKVLDALEDKKQADTYARKQKQILSKAALEGESAIFKLGSKTPMTHAAQLRLINSAMIGAQAYRQLANIKRAVALWDFMANYDDKENTFENRIVALQTLSGIYTAEAQPETAKKYLKQGLSLAEKSGKTSVALELLQENIELLKTTGENEEALRIYSILISTAESIGNIRTSIVGRVGRGKMLASVGKYDEAINDLQNACQRWLNIIGDFWKYADTATALADVYVKVGRSKEAVGLLETALLEATASSAFNLDSYDSGRTLADISGRLVRFYTESGEIERAADLLSKYSASPWMPILVRDLSGDSNSKIDMLLLESTEKTSSEDMHVSDVSYRILAENPASFTTVCWNLLETRKAEYQSLPINPLNVMSSRYLMSAKEVFIEYMLTDSSVYIFVVGQDTARCVEVRDASRNVAQAYRNFKHSIAKCEMSLNAGVPVAPVVTRDEAEYLEIREPLNRLYKLLIEPIEGLSENSLLLFALPAQILGLPVHALVDVDEQGNASYLCERYTVTFASSNSHVFGKNLGSAVNNDSVSLAIFADPNGDLPGAKSEAQMISDVFKNSRLYVGAQATADKLYKELTSADMLHIAAHHSIELGLTAPLLKLAKKGDDDGSIFLADLLSRQPIKTKIVFLSVCDALYSSNSMSDSLNRTGEAFLLAGAWSVLGGLWKISDEAEALLAKEFYAGIAEGESVYQAIRRAQLSMIKSTSGRFSHPYYWAALALYGNPE